MVEHWYTGKWKSRTLADTDSDSDSDSDSDLDTNTAKSGKGHHRLECQDMHACLHDYTLAGDVDPGYLSRCSCIIYYSDSGSQKFLIFSPKTVQSLPHPVATINFLCGYHYLESNVGRDSHDIDNERHDNKYCSHYIMVATRISGLRLPKIQRDYSRVEEVLREQYTLIR